MLKYLKKKTKCLRLRKTVDQLHQKPSEHATDLLKYPWYHGMITRNYCDMLLNPAEDGTYLIRETRIDSGNKIISFKLNTRVHHARVNEDCNGKVFLVPNIRFNSIPDLVEHYSHNCLSIDLNLEGILYTKLLYPFPKTLFPEPDEWELTRNEFKIGKVLGSGFFGDVFEATWDRYNLRVAVKSLIEGTMTREKFLEEAAVMKETKHPNLVQLIGICTLHRPLYIITEFMSNGNLRVYLHSHPQMSVVSLIDTSMQIANGMKYLESKNFIHRDLAARNCLVDENNVVKIADFGLARILHSHDAYVAQNNTKPVKWTAPEGLARNFFTTKSDVWSFGVLLWEIFTYGASPYAGIANKSLFNLLKDGYRMNIPANTPLVISKVIKRCWNWEYTERPRFEDIHTVLKKLFMNFTVTKDQSCNRSCFSKRFLKQNKNGATASDDLVVDTLVCDNYGSAVSSAVRTWRSDY